MYPDGVGAPFISPSAPIYIKLHFPNTQQHTLEIIQRYSHTRMHPGFSRTDTFDAIDTITRIRVEAAQIKRGQFYWIRNVSAESKKNPFRAILAHVLNGRERVLLRRAQAIKIAKLNNGTDLFILSNQTFCLHTFLLTPVQQVTAYT